MLRKISMLSLMAMLAFCSTNKSSVRITEWVDAGKLPSPQGFAESIGVAGSYAGFIGDFLVVAGGSNFPYGAILEGGAKEFYSDIFVFQVGNNYALELVGTAQLPQKLSGGATVVMDSSLLIVGGENAGGEVSNIYSISLNNTTPVITEVAQLPFTWSLGAAVVQDQILYLFAGRNNKKAVNKTWAFNLSTKEMMAKADLPGEPRIQMPYAMESNKVFIFNGIGSVVLTDNYAYDITTDTWKKLADTTLNNGVFTVTGGAATLIDNNSILVLGGVNKQVFDDAVSNLTTLQGADLEAFRQDYFNRTPEQFDFSKQEMVYDIANNKWSSIGQLPFYGGAGPFPLLKKGSAVWVISGEIKAGVRVPDIRVGVLAQ